RIPNRESRIANPESRIANPESRIPNRESLRSAISGVAERIEEQRQVVMRLSCCGFEGDDDGWEQRARADPVEIPPRVEREAIQAWRDRRPVSHQSALPSLAVG